MKPRGFTLAINSTWPSSSTLAESRHAPLNGCTLCDYQLADRVAFDLKIGDNLR